jgi:hypothetical protein
MCILTVWWDACGAGSTENARLYTAADRWARQLDQLTPSIVNRIA